MLVSKNLTEAERGDALSLETGDVLVYHQNARGRRKGERVVVEDAPPPLEQTDRFQVFHASTLPLAVGDRVRITRNGSTLDGRHRLNNGATYAIKRFDRQHNLVLDNGWTVARDYGHLAHGYTSTSHSAQGRTVDRVLIAQSSDSLPASGMEQFYVSVSRGRRGVTVYTDDKDALLEAVAQVDERMTATEMVHGQLAAAIRRGIEHDPYPQPGTRELHREHERERIHE